VCLFKGIIVDCLRIGCVECFGGSDLCVGGGCVGECVLVLHEYSAGWGLGFRAL